MPVGIRMKFAGGTQEQHDTGHAHLDVDANPREGLIVARRLGGAIATKMRTLLERDNPNSMRAEQSASTARGSLLER